MNHIYYNYNYYIMDNEILYNKLLKSVNNTSNVINSTLKNIDNRYFSYYINNITKHNLLKYIFIIIIIFFVISKHKITLNILVSIIISILLLTYFISNDYEIMNIYNDDIDLQLEFLNQILFDKDNYISNEINQDFNINPSFNESYLHLNPVIINFYYNMKEYSQYNLNAFKNSLMYTNTLISLDNQIKKCLINPYINYSSIKKLYKDSLNNYQSIIYSIPVNNLSAEKFNSSIKILQKLLYKIVDNVKNKCKEYNLLNEIKTDIIPDTILEMDYIINPNDLKQKDYSNNFSLY